MRRIPAAVTTQEDGEPVGTAVVGAAVVGAAVVGDAVLGAAVVGRVVVGAAVVGAAVLGDAVVGARGILVRGLANYSMPEFIRATVGLETQNRILVDHLSAFLKA